MSTAFVAPGPETHRRAPPGAPTWALVAVAAAAIGLVTTAALVLRARRLRAATAPAIAAGSMPVSDPARAELRGARVLRLAPPQTALFVAEIENAGEALLATPSVNVELFDERGLSAGRGRCESPVPTLAPGMRAPCAARLDEVGAFVRHTAALGPSERLEPSPVELGAELSRLDAASAEETAFATVRVDNPTGRAMRRVVVVVTALDAAGAVEGLGATELDAPLPAAGSAQPRVALELVAGPPARTTVRALGW